MYFIEKFSYQVTLFLTFRFRELYINTLNFQQAEHALKLGKLFTAEEALKLHLVNDLVDSPSELNEKAQSELEKWLKIPGNSGYCRFSRNF